MHTTMLTYSRVQTQSREMHLRNAVTVLPNIVARVHRVQNEQRVRLKPWKIALSLENGQLDISGLVGAGAGILRAMQVIPRHQRRQLNNVVCICIH